MHRIFVDNRILTASDGEWLSDVFLRFGLTVAHPCGGRGVCKKCRVRVNGTEELSCRYRVHSDITVQLPASGDIESVSGGTFAERKSNNVCFALDIGTTTLALALVSLDECKMIEVITRVNPQSAYGADVISRIAYCAENGVRPLHETLIHAVNSMLAHFGNTKAETLYAAGNTAMLHFLFNSDCTAMGTAPYIPAFLHARTEDAAAYGLIGVQKVVSLPCISAFVGADLVAGLHCVKPTAAGKYSLLLDLGTNAEVLLFSQNRLLCTSAAAGPCFEGASISQGMAAVQGAISAFSMQNGRIFVRTIGGSTAVGICGTGLIDIVASLLENNILDETGFLSDDSFEAAPGVFLEQEDVRQFQLAKSAVYSAVCTLLKRENIGFDKVETLYISGGFSAHINIENAVRCGLLPAELKDRCVSLNNSSLQGTLHFACVKTLPNDVMRLLENAQYIDLAADLDFADLFIENMQMKKQSVVT